MRPISFSDADFIKDGNNKNVTNKEITNPNVIIHPKSIIGFIPLKTKEKSTYCSKNCIELEASFFYLLQTQFHLLSLGLSFFIVKILLLREYSLPYLK